MKRLYMKKAGIAGMFSAVLIVSPDRIRVLHNVPTSRMNEGQDMELEDALKIGTPLRTFFPE
jgi:hypothetical protein